MVGFIVANDRIAVSIVGVSSTVAVAHMDIAAFEVKIIAVAGRRYTGKIRQGGILGLK
ncbi:MAG: hypothetical protein WAK53_14450 [Chromatiaceae bacterium]